ncbi:hypothetical protein CQW23_09089 [Capsicum baccatum]|uniref:Tf2-1-like SH3-like domain-containing protein n=1 Tax=Capsicum baccatum TaxID=33114 RepID=A0A2G2WVT8_CAPBA|nr:hypothetical protein CQW23_09089 [Capsicum baccatum]
MRQGGAVEGALPANHHDVGCSMKKKNKKYQPTDEEGTAHNNKNKTGGFKGNYPPCKHCSKLGHAPFKCWKRLDAKCTKCNQLGNEAIICKNKTQQQDVEARVVDEQEEDQLFVASCLASSVSNVQVNEQDLTAKRLAELKSHLQELQSETNLWLERVNSYMSTIHELTIFMSLDFKKIIANINPSLANHLNGQSKYISNETLANLKSEVNSLKQLKQQRLERIQDLGSSLIELWNLIDMPMEEQRRFNHLTSLVSFSIDEITRQGSFSIRITEPEVETPYEIVYGQKPPPLLPDSQLDAVDRSLSAREATLRLLKSNLLKAQNKMKVQAGKKRSDRCNEIGDWVYVKLQPYRQVSLRSHSFQKLSAKFFGTFEIIAKVGMVACTLALPEVTKLHPTFHVSQLKKRIGSHLSSTTLPIVHSDSGYVLLVPERVLDRRIIKKHGEIPKQISNLVELEVLILGYNSFSGRLNMEIFNISGLRIIDLTFNNLSGSLPPNIGSILPNIEVLYLGNLTNLEGTVPHSISNCSKPTILELSYNQLTGLIPNSLGYLTHLQYLNLGGNNLTSDSSLSFLTSLSNNRNLTVLYLYFNPLNGMLPASTGNLSTSLRKFYANSCKIKGRIPNEVGNISSLLDLDLSGNNLVGSIPTSIGNLRDLQRFNLSSNKLTRFIGDHICKLHYLSAIYLGQNQLSGPLPNCLGNVTSLREIHLGSNKLSYNIPPSIGNLQDLVVLDLSSNNMVGTLPPEIGNLKAATLIDLSMNRFSNGIPREIGGLQTLMHLSLRHNKLQGSIPDSMSNTVGLEFLDLSDNNLSGTIPMSLEKLQNLKYFNVSVMAPKGWPPISGWPWLGVWVGFVPRMVQGL